MHVATIQEWLLFLSQSSMCGYYSRAATNRGAASIRINTVIIIIMILLCNEKLDHIPSSCIVLTVHMVKGRQHSTRHIDASALIAEMESEIDSRPRQGQILMLQSQEMNSIVQCNFQTSDWLWHDACYI